MNHINCGEVSSVTLKVEYVVDRSTRRDYVTVPGTDRSLILRNLSMDNIYIFTITYTNNENYQSPESSILFCQAGNYK